VRYAAVCQAHTRRGQTVRQKVLIRAIRSLAWGELRDAEPGSRRACDVLWFSGIGDPPLGTFARVRPDQRIARFPFGFYLFGKVGMHRAVTAHAAS
jgi:hypothetical protein